MAFRRALLTVAAQALVFASGAAAYGAWRQGLYATATVAVLVGLWTVAWMVARTRSPRAPAAVPAPEPSMYMALERDRRTLRGLLDQTPAPLIAYGADGVIRAVNRAGRALFGTDDRVLAAPAELAAALAAAEPGERRVVRLDQAGGGGAFAFSASDIWTPEGAVRLAALTDIQAEMQVAEAAALRDLLQVHSHEIMNSLTPVASLAETAEQLLADGGPESIPLARDALQTLARRSEGLARFVRSYRELARLPAPQLQATALSELMSDVARLFRSRWRAEEVVLEVQPPSPEVRIMIDPGLMAQALINLLINAGEACLQDGRTPRTVWLQARPSGGGAEIIVRDNGPGVRLPEPEMIFHPFVTTKERGTGIGLALARQIVLSHGGDLRLAAPVEGAGAEFIVTLGRSSA